MDVNVNKTKVMRVTKGGKNAKKSFNLGNTQLENTTFYKYLRTIFSSSGSFTFAKRNMYDRGLKALYNRFLLIPPE